jgi:acetate kinase
MKIVIINSGSSSIKYQLITMPTQEVVCSGMIDRIGLETSNLLMRPIKVESEPILTIKNLQIMRLING